VVAGLPRAGFELEASAVLAWLGEADAPAGRRVAAAVAVA
jgi:hypothetical protein